MSFRELRSPLGALAHDVLVRHRAVRDSASRGSSTSLRALLRKRKYPVHEAVLAFDERYGGLLIPEEARDEPDMEMAWTLGAYACLSTNAHSNPRGGLAARGL